MTTPAGVPNLPPGALTLETLAANLQDMSGTAMKNRAVERFPSIMDGSTGLSPASDLTPFGILTRIWAEINSLIANADPGDINGPEDIPGLLIEFIEGLPVVGQFVDLLEAILGTYDGEDQVLLQIQEWAAAIPFLRDIVEVFTGVEDGDLNDLGTWVNNILQALRDAAEAFAATLTQVPLIGDIMEAISGKEDGDVDDLGTAWNNTVGEIQRTLESIWQGIMQTIGLGAITQENAAEAIASQTNALIGMNASIAQLFAALGAGSAVSDDFERADADDLGPGWNVIIASGGAGNYHIDGHNASFGFTGTLSYHQNEAVALFNGAPGLTDNGAVSMVLANSNQWQGPLVSASGGCVDLWARMAGYGFGAPWSARTGVRARLNGNHTASLCAYNSGVETVLATVNILDPPAGAIFQLLYGVGGNPRRYIVTVSGKPIIDVTEGVSGVPVAVTISPNHRYRGMGHFAVDGGLLAPVASGARVMQWTAQG